MSAREIYLLVIPVKTQGLWAISYYSWCDFCQNNSCAVSHPKEWYLNLHFKRMLPARKGIREMQGKVEPSRACMPAQSCLTLGDPMGCSPPSSSVHGIFRAWPLAWVGPLQPRGQTWGSCTFSHHCVSRGARNSRAGAQRSLWKLRGKRIISKREPGWQRMDG